MSNVTAAALDNYVTLPTRPASAILAVLRMAVFVVISLGGLAVCTILNAMNIKPLHVAQWYFGTCARLLGFRVIVRGERTKARPTLLVSNHISYFDIFVLGGLAPSSFVAKAEISKWPFFGVLGRSGRTVFVSRRRSASGTAADDIQSRMDEGDTLIMFPESTSHDGNRVRPFKSALFTVAEQPTKDGRPVTVQPVSIAYTRLNGLPLGIGWRSFIAWYGDMDLMPHLWQALKLGTVTAEVTFHAPVTIDQFRDRKALAAHCTRASADGVARLISGREAA